MRKQTLTLLIALLAFPVNASAVSVDTLDTVAGLATEVVIEDLAPNTQTRLEIVSPIGESFGHTLNVGSQGIAHTWIAGNDLQVAGEYDLTVDDMHYGSLTVYPDTVDTVRSFIELQSQAADVGQEVVATVVVMDRFGNALSGRSMELISGRSDDLVQAINRETDMYGEQQFLVRAATPGTVSLRAIDLISGKTLDGSAQLIAGDARGAVGGPAVAYSAPQQFYRGNPYSANLLAPAVPAANPYRAQLTEPPRFDHIEIDIIGQENAASPTVEQYKAESMLLTAVDQYGNRFFEYIGTAYMATTDPEATLPAFGVYDFRFEDEGQKMLTLGLKFATPGEQTMVLTDAPDEIPSDLSLALGMQSITVAPQQINKPVAQNILITAPRNRSLLNTTDVVVEGTGPAFINIVVEGGKEEVRSETDRQGGFSVPVALDPTQTEHTLTVKDADAPTNVAEVTFTIDVTPPEISAITFTPENPVEETDVLAVVQSEPGLAQISMQIGEQTFQLQNTDPTSGKYQMLLAAPVGGVVYDVTVEATDTQGNIATETATLPVSLRGLPKVQSVIAEAQINAIALRWNPVTSDEIDAYRIYVGTDPNEFLYTLDTDRPTAAATVAGLRPGTSYYFAVTALEGERESAEKSDTVSATVLGVKLDITPGDGALFVEWNSLQQDIPLSNFVLNYTTDVDALDDPSRSGEVESRTLNGELRAYQLRDLINGVTYHLKLVPITTTGEALDDLAATGQGTPIGAGFTAGTSDPVPLDLRASAPPVSQPVNQIPLSEQGVPMWMLWTVLGTSGAVFHFYLRRRKQNEMTSAFLQAMETRYHQ